MTLVLTAHGPTHNARGIAAMLAAMAGLIVNDAFIKMAAQSLPMGQAIFLRGLVTTFLCAALVLAITGLGAPARLWTPPVLVRSLAEVAATLLYLSALFNMPIADATAILQFTPLAITAGAALFLGAPVGWRRWLATLAGLAGVLLIVRPGGAGFNAYALVALAAVVFVAARDLITRRLRQEVTALAIATSSSVAVALASLGFALFEPWRGPSAFEAGMLVCAGAALAAGQLFIVVAMRTGEIAVVAPFRYSIILWAVLAGFLVWGEVPDAVSWAGIAIVSAAGLYTFLREQQLARAGRT